jgi:hypothetical protein
LFFALNADSQLYPIFLPQIKNIVNLIFHFSAVCCCCIVDTMRNADSLFTNSHVSSVSRTVRHRAMCPDKLQPCRVFFEAFGGRLRFFVRPSQNLPGKSYANGFAPRPQLR